MIYGIVEPKPEQNVFHAGGRFHNFGSDTDHSDR